MTTILEEAQALQAVTIKRRRYLHQNPELGMELPKTCDFVRGELSAMGCSPQEICPCGLTAMVGQGGPVLLLRADMDALPMSEESGLDFAAQNGCAHTCGHDLHTAMLLGAAQILKAHEHELTGTVKLMFQPAEETISGAAAMVAAGVLSDPPVDAALALHVSSLDPTGVVYYRAGDIYASADGFRIHITGRGGHGASPESCIDPINIAVQIYTALQTIISREKSPSKQAVLTIGSIHGGSANNVISDTVEMLGTLRTYDDGVRQMIKERIEQISQTIAAMYGGTAEVTYFNGTPSMSADTAFTGEVVDALRQVLPPERVEEFPIIFSGSEDFAEVSARVRATMLILGCAAGEDCYTHHNPKVTFDEDAMAYGVAAYAGAALGWLGANSRG